MFIDHAWDWNGGKGCGMGIGFQAAARMRLKLEINGNWNGNWNGNYLMAFGGNRSTKRIVAHLFYHILPQSLLNLTRLTLLILHSARVTLRT